MNDLSRRRDVDPTSDEKGGVSRRSSSLSPGKRGEEGRLENDARETPTR